MPDEPAELTFDEIEVGSRASFRQQIDQDHLARFAILSGDFNPLHMDENYAGTTEFGRPIVHGMLLASLLSRLVGMHLPGRRALYLSQNIDFAGPVFAGEEVEVVGEVLRKQDAMQTLTMRTEIRVPPARLALRGKATVRVLP